MTVPTDQTELRDVIRDPSAAAAAATAEQGASCCGTAAAIITDEQRQLFGSPLYDAEDGDQLPDDSRAGVARVRQPDRHRRGPRRVRPS